jgi:hypothetical protein
LRMSHDKRLTQPIRAAQPQPFDATSFVGS